ncbi:MAG: ABC transporter substrate-binding protein [Mariprofundaceae bacterium]|nr:ABC transporter substrate-binding protein [Mariprofundaceae bacterium]
MDAIKALRWGLLCLLVMLSACQQQVAEPGELRIGVAQLPISLDPRFSTDAASYKIQALMYRGLIRLGDDFIPRADIASSWQHPDALTWVFELKKDVYFHDGSRLQAKDVAATLRGVLNKDLSSPLRASFASIESVDVLSPYRLRLNLNKADSSLLTRLSLGIVPENMANKPQQARKMIGAGAFKLQSWHGNDLRLLRVQHSSTSNIEVLHFIRVKDAVTRCLKLVRGEIDFTQNDLPPELLPYLKKQKQLRIQTRASTTFSYIGMNTQDAILKDIRVRRALALAVDRKRLKKALFLDLPVLAETVLTPQHWAATKLPETEFNREKAEVMLDKAGFPRAKNGVRFTLNYRTSTDPARLRLATAIADMWQKIGVQVSIESLEWGGFYARIKRGDFQVFSLSWVGIVDPDIYRWILHSDMWPPKGANRGRYSNTDVDRWLERASESESIKQRKQIYAKVQEKMQQEQVYIPLWYEPVLAVSSKRLQGFKPSSDGGLLGLLKANIRLAD